MTMPDFCICGEKLVYGACTEHGVDPMPGPGRIPADVASRMRWVAPNLDDRVARISFSSGTIHSLKGCFPFGTDINQKQLDALLELGHDWCKRCGPDASPQNLFRREGKPPRSFIETKYGIIRASKDLEKCWKPTWKLKNPYGSKMTLSTPITFHVYPDMKHGNKHNVRALCGKMIYRPCIRKLPHEGTHCKRCKICERILNELLEGLDG